MFCVLCVVFCGLHVSVFVCVLRVVVWAFFVVFFLFLLAFCMFVVRAVCCGVGVNV